MELKGKFKIIEIKKKTAAKFFKDLKPGDEFELRYDINGSYGQAASVDIFQHGRFKQLNNALQLKNNLSNFEVVQLED